MTEFCVIRHAETGGLGTSPDSALAHYVSLGWERVSDWSREPSDFVLSEYTDAEGFDDGCATVGPGGELVLQPRAVEVDIEDDPAAEEDAPAEPPAKARKTTKKNTEPEENS